MDKKSIDAELFKFYPEFSKATSVDFNFLKCVVAQHWNRGGAQEDASECFTLFCKKG
jgi:hypothetical protein